MHKITLKINGKTTQNNPLTVFLAMPLAMPLYIHVYVFQKLFLLY